MKSFPFGPKIGVTLFLLLSFTDVLSAQFTSAIEGRVADPTGAFVPNAQVLLQDVTTQTVHETLTGQEGYFRFSSLAASVYNLKVLKPGFQTVVFADVRVQVSEVKSLNIPLTLGVENTEITVAASLTRVETSEARISELISDEKLHDLPLVGRNFYGLVLLTPGVAGLPSSGGDIFNTNFRVDLFAAGHRSESNNFLVDSVSVTSTPRGGIVNLSPNVDSVQEVRISVNHFDAGLGRNAAAVVNVVTKQGTNRWHGTGSWFHGQDSLSARTVFQKDVPQFQRNQIAATLGGPIRKDRTFMFGSAEALRAGTGTAFAAFVATPQFIDLMQRNRPGNISTYLWKSFPAAVTPTRNFVTAGQLTGVNCSSLTSTDSEIVSSVGNVPCNLPVTGEGDFATSVPRKGFQWNSRVDHHARDGRDRFYVNVYSTELEQGGAFVYPAFNAVSPSSSLYVNLNQTHIISSRMINEATLSYVRSWGRQGVEHGEIPLIFPTGITGFGTGTGPSTTARNNFEFRDSLAWTTGTHSMRAGGNLQRGRSNGDFTGLSLRPGFLFTNVLDFANDRPNRQVNISFDPITGAPKGLVQAIRTMTVGLFLQDDWKVTPRFTINMGLRWETFGNPADGNERMTNIVFRGGNDLFSRIADAKVDYVPKLYKSADLNNWAPRVGFAWDATGHGTVSVRGGFGIFFDRPSDQLYLNASSNTPVIARAEASVLTPPILPFFALGAQQQPPYYFPIPPGIRPGLDEKNGLLSGAKVQLLTSDPNFRTQYAQNWFVGVQYSPARKLFLELNYVGSAGRKLYGQTDINRFSGDLIQNNGVLTRLNRSFGVIEYGESNLNSSYHGATLSLKSRFAGQSIDAAYTVSKAIDQFSMFHPMGGAQLPVAELTDLRRQRGVADFDVPQKLAVSTIWRLPGFRGEVGFLDKILSNWEVAAIAILQSGTPFSVICSRPFIPVRDSTGRVAGNNGCDYNADGFNYDFPDTPSFGNSKDGWTRSDYTKGVLNRVDFPAPALGRQGNLGRNTFRGPGYAGVDLAVLKNVALPSQWAEDLKLQLRGEIFNLFNRVNLTSVNGDLASPQFGRSTSSLPARNIQLGVRLEF